MSKSYLQRACVRCDNSAQRCDHSMQGKPEPRVPVTGSAIDVLETLTVLHGIFRAINRFSGAVMQRSRGRWLDVAAQGHVPVGLITWVASDFSISTGGLSNP